MPKKEKKAPAGLKERLEREAAERNAAKAANSRAVKTAAERRESAERKRQESVERALKKEREEAIALLNVARAAGEEASKAAAEASAAAAEASRAAAAARMASQKKVNAKFLKHIENTRRFYASNGRAASHGKTLKEGNSGIGGILGKKHGGRRTRKNRK